MASEGRFIPVAEAAAMKEGCRCTGLQGWPGIWVIAIKSLYHVKKVPVIHVEHPMSDQSELIKHTAQASNPVTWWAEEYPKSCWLEQMTLAERIGSGPTLLPKDPATLAEVIGLCHLALGSPEGLTFEKRNILMSAGAFSAKYYWSEERKAEAPKKVIALLTHVDGVLQKQKAKGSKFLVGDSITAADVCWASAMVIVAPPDESFIPVNDASKPLLTGFASNPPEIASAITPLLLEHQLFILKEFCDLPGLLAGKTNSY